MNITAQFVGPGLLINSGVDMCAAPALLKGAGFKWLGRGSDAEVFGNGSRVIKIVCNDAGHRAAVAMFANHPDCAAFPDVYGVTDWPNGCFAYETELLADRQEWSQGFYLDDARDYLADPAAYRDEYGAHDSIGAFTDEFGDELLTIIATEADPSQRFVDLHSDNIMVRADGTSVLADPFHMGETSDRRLRSNLQRSTQDTFKDDDGELLAFLRNARRFATLKPRWSDGSY